MPVVKNTGDAVLVSFTNALSNLLGFIPSLIGARSPRMGMGSPDLLAGVARYAILGFAVVAALDELQIAATVGNTLFIGLVASLALAVGLAFGLGGRDVAARMTESWYVAGKSIGGQAANGNGASSHVQAARPEAVANRPATWRSNAS